MLLQLLCALVSSRQGAMALVEMEDLSSITEIAPSHAIAMDILRHAWLNAMVVVDDTAYLVGRIDGNIQSLVSSFRGTDAVTFLEFLGLLLRQVSSEVSKIIQGIFNEFLTRKQIRSFHQIQNG